LDDRKLYQRKLEAQLEEWQADLDKLVARAKQADADTRIAAERQIEDLQARQRVARERLDDLRAAGVDAWKDLASAAEKAFDDMSDGLRAAADRFESGS
jgi:hypothetical protein